MLLMPGGLDRLNTQGRRRVAVAVQAVQLALAPDQGKRIAAQGRNRWVLPPSGRRR